MGYTPPWLHVVGGVAKTSVYPIQGTTGDDLFVYSNTTDARPFIQLGGNEFITLDVASGSIVYLKNAGTTFLQLQYDSGNNQVKLTNPIDAKDFYLATTGTGVLKFGTHTGSGDVACNGSIAIKDAAGNARKLMTTA